MTIRNKEMEFSFGPMAEDMKAPGSMASSMGMEITQPAKEKQRKANGKMARESNGLEEIPTKGDLIMQMNE